jgi:predicted ATPase
VGREQEVGLLLERLAHVKDGMGQVVVLSGEAGIGKSRLVQVLQERAITEGATCIPLRCSPYHTNSALYPVIEHLERLLQLRRDETPQDKVANLEQALGASRLPQAEVVPLLATLLSLQHPQGYASLSLSPQQQRQKTQEALVAWLLEEAERQPVLAVWEDLHWADPSTLDLLSLVIDQAPTARLLTLLTCRPEYRPPWTSRSYFMQLALSRLGHSQVEVMITRLTGGKVLPAEVVQQIVAKTDGVPLFVKELTKAVLESAGLRETDGRYELTGPLPTLAIPATLQDSLMARLDRLVTAKGLAQLCATLGRQFTYELLQAVAPLDEATLRRELERLVQAELLYQRGLPPRAMYVFKHALIQEIAYHSLLKRTRQQYHQQIAQVLEEGFPDTTEKQPELLAQHYTEAGLAEQAVAYWLRAGERNRARSADVEAVAHLTKGLDVLRTLPDTPTRAEREVDMQLTLGRALAVAKGFGAPETGHAYARARELCQQAGDTGRLFAILVGLREFHLNRGELYTAREQAEACLPLAQRQQDAASLMRAHFGLGSILSVLGELVPARAHLAQAIALYAPQQDRSLIGQAPLGVPCFARAAITLWHLGYPDQALMRSDEMLALAQELADAYNLVRALVYAAQVHLLRREWSTAQERAEASLALSTEQAFVHWVGPATFWRGWALAAQGHYEEGMAQMQQGLAARQATGNLLTRAAYLARLAEAGLCRLAEALIMMDQTGARCDEPELYRIKGELLRRQAVPDDSRAEACFQHALAVARHRQAKSWELRAAMSLGHLWQQQGKREQACELLASIYGWFTEGFDTADLQEAKALLEEPT